MFKKILRVQNLGLLQDACAAGAVTLGGTTMIYADNGRGKSTCAAMMRACHLRDGGRMAARKTLDSDNLPIVDFLLATGDHIEFKGDTWAGSPPPIAVFDSEFVDHNVYSGFEVRSDQRQNLLEFALGETTVALKQQIEQLSNSIKTQTALRGEAEKQLKIPATPYSVSQFIDLSSDPDVQSRIESTQKRIAAAKNAAVFNQRPVPERIEPIQFDLPRACCLLEETLADLEQRAEAEVKAHFSKQAHDGFEEWIGEGQKYLAGSCCPFCGQATDTLSLIRSYQAYFSDEYAKLKAAVEAMLSKAETSLSGAKMDAIAARHAMNKACVAAWADQFEVAVPGLDVTELETVLNDLRATVIELISIKRQQPLAVVEQHSMLAEAHARLEFINTQIEVYNQQIDGVAARIAEFKALLGTDKVPNLETELKKLEAVARRGSPEVEAVVRTWQSADAERNRLENEKGELRKKIDTSMYSTLNEYQAQINRLLRSFGAEFTIEQLKPTYVGGSGNPRSEFVLHIRNRAVKLGSRMDVTSDHSFASTLSEADKRTLAFAFFMARLQTDLSLKDTIVVLDDPVSSLDRNRRQESERLISGLATKCCQLIVLSHDAYFIRELRDCLTGLKPTAIDPTILVLKRVTDGYSVFSTCDIDDLCESDYYRHYKVVSDFVNGKTTCNSRDVAKAIRPLLEGYYRRRFPLEISKRVMFGEIITIATDSQNTGPLQYLRPIAQELQEINDYAKMFHHDSNQGAGTNQVVDTELLTYARRALQLIHRAG